MTVIPINLRPMHDRPAPGQKVRVWMKDGRVVECSACRVTMSGIGRSGIVLYEKRRALDESGAKGWLPA